MLLNEIKSIQPLLDGLFERAEGGDPEAQLIVEGVMSALSDMGKRFVGAAKGKAKIIALSMALIIPAMSPNLATAGVSIEDFIEIIQSVETLSDKEFYLHQAQRVSDMRKQAAADFPLALENPKFITHLKSMLKMSKDEYIQELKQRIEDEVSGQGMEVQEEQYDKAIELRDNVFSTYDTAGQSPALRQAENEYRAYMPTTHPSVQKRMGWKNSSSDSTAKE